MAKFWWLFSVYSPSPVLLSLCLLSYTGMVPKLKNNNPILKRSNHTVILSPDLRFRWVTN